LASIIRIYHDARPSECQKSLLSDRIHIFRLAGLPTILSILYLNYNMFRQKFMSTIMQCLHKTESLSGGGLSFASSGYHNLY